jgi:ubiquinone/menaquinone biosynthesis C-methylase UbiE
VREAVILSRKFSAKEVERSFSEAAWFYDIWARLTESKAEMRALQLADVQDGENALEVAVGTGILFEELVKRNRSGRNEGIDISPSMLSRATKRLARQNNEHYNLQIGSAYDLPFVANAFDLVINSYMLDLMPEENFGDILGEFYRVLKPSGKIIITSMSYGRKWYNGFWSLVARYFPSLLTNCRPVALRDYLIKVGFEDIAVEDLSQSTFPSQVLRAKKR